MTSWLETIYDHLAREKDERVCLEITDEACRSVPRNFFIQIASQILTKLGDNLASPKTVLTWLMAYVGAPGFLIGLLVPVRESLSMLPQIFIGGVMRRLPRRKPVWLIGSLLQCAAIGTIGLSAATQRGAAAGWTILVCVVVFSLARGLNSLASKDILGKTIPKTRRGRLGGISTGLSGLMATAFGLWMLSRSGAEPTAAFYGRLLAGAGALWLLAVVIFAGLEEHAGETAKDGNGFRDALGRLGLLRSDPAFGRFVLSRALILSTALTAPYYVLLARHEAGTGLGILGAFIMANGLASSFSAPVWGVFADRSSRRVLITGAATASILGFALFALVETAPGLMRAAWVYPIAFFGLGVAHAGVRAGRKTYVVDMAGGVKRTDYISVGNSVIGLVLLLVGLGLGALSFLAPHVMILILALMSTAGVIAAASLPEVE